MNTEGFSSSDPINLVLKLLRFDRKIFAKHFIFINDFTSTLDRKDKIYLDKFKTKIEKHVILFYFLKVFKIVTIEFYLTKQ